MHAALGDQPRRSRRPGVERSAQRSGTGRTVASRSAKPSSRTQRWRAPSSITQSRAAPRDLRPSVSAERRAARRPRRPRLRSTHTHAPAARRDCSRPRQSAAPRQSAGDSPIPTADHDHQTLVQATRPASSPPQIGSRRVSQTPRVHSLGDDDTLTQTLTTADHRRGRARARRRRYAQSTLTCPAPPPDRHHRLTARAARNSHTTPPATRLTATDIHLLRTPQPRRLQQRSQLSAVFAHTQPRSALPPPRINAARSNAFIHLAAPAQLYQHHNAAAPPNPSHPRLNADTPPRASSRTLPAR